MRTLETLGSASLLISVAFIAGWAFNEAIDSLPLALGLTFFVVAVVAFGLTRFVPLRDGDGGGD